MRVKRETFEGVSLKDMLARMDAAGIDKAFLIAAKVGRLGHPACYHVDYRLVADAVQEYPDRFLGLAGLDPTEGMHGVRELVRAVTNTASSARISTHTGLSCRPTMRNGTRSMRNAPSSTCRCSSRSGSP